MGKLQGLLDTLQERLGRKTKSGLELTTFASTRYHMNNIRDLLFSGLTQKELRRLCKHMIESGPIYEQLGSRTKKSQAAQLLLDYARQNSQIEVVLVWVREHFPAKYEKYQPFYELDVRPAASDSATQEEDGQGKKSIQAHCGTTVKAQTTKTTVRPTESERSESLRQASLEKHRKKRIRRRILDEFESLIRGEGNLDQVAVFITKFQDKVELMREALGPFKRSDSFAAIVVWHYLSGDTDRQLDQLIEKHRVLANLRSRLVDEMSDPIVVPIRVTEYGPRLETATREVHQLIEQRLGRGLPDYQIKCDFPFTEIRDYSAHLEFSGDLQIPFTIELNLQQEELPADYLEYLEDTPSITLSQTEDVLRQMQTYLASATVANVLEHFPCASSVLKTAYEQGYWKNAWVQDLLFEWQSRRNEYSISLELYKVRELAEHFDSNGPQQIPEVNDTEELDEQGVIAIARDFVSRDAELSQYKIDFRFEGDVSRSILPVDMLWNGQVIGTLNLLRVAPYLPTDIHQEIRQAGMNDLSSILACTSKEQLLREADRETSRALNVMDDEGHGDHRARAQRLVGICRILLERGEGEGVQFKRTLTCYYTAKGGELFYDNNTLGARRYYLLFFRMLYREKMLEHLKAIRALDYPVLAAFFATYLSQQARMIRTPEYRRVLGKSHRYLKRQSPMLWRAAQLGAESRQKFFAAILELYLIDESFVCTLLDDLRRIKKAGAYNLDYLNMDSQKLPKDIVIFLFEGVSQSVPNEQLLNFIMAVLDTRDIAQPVFNDFNQVLTAARQFVIAQDVVQKSTLYTDVDREFLQARRVVDRLIGTRLRLSERTRKGSVPLRRLLQEIKEYVDRMHRDFFKSARLQVEINTFELPRDQLSPVEMQITNAEVGPANKITVKIERNSTLKAREYSVPLEPLFGKEKRVEALWLSPLSDKAVELRGVIEYSDQESQDKTKEVPFRYTIRVSAPEDFEPFKSPYAPGDPVRNSEMFFGRRKELNEIVRFLRGYYQDRVTVIHGQRRIGKTSILWQFKNGNPDILGVPALVEIRESCFPVYITFERFTKEKPTWEIYYRIYKEVYDELGLADICTDQISIDNFRDLPADVLLEDFIVHVIQLLDSRNLKLLLMFDEFDTLIRNKGEERGLFGFLREMIIKRGEHMSFIFVGADELVGMMKTRTNRLYDMASGTVLKIQDLTPEESKQLIVQPMKKVDPKFAWAEGAVQLIIHLTAGNPYYIQTLCAKVITNLNAGKRSRATTIDIEQGAKEVSNDIGTLADTVKSLGNVREKIVLTSIADITRHERLDRIWVAASQIEQHLHDFSPNFPGKDIPGILRILKEKYILDQRESAELEMEYSIRVPLLRMYIQNSLRLGDVLREGRYA